MDPTASTTGSPPLPPLLVALRERTAELLKPRLAVVAEAMADYLFNLSASAKLSPDGRTQAFEAFSLLSSRSKHFVDVVATDCDSAFDSLTTTKATESSAAEPSAELDLVDIREFENSLAIERIVQAGSERYWIPLEAMTLRISDILGDDPRRVRLPMGLRGLVTAYRRYLTELDLPGDIVEEMDRAYMRNLLPEIGTIYAELNTLLEEAGVRPGLEAELETGGSQLKAAQTSPRPRAASPSKPQESFAPEEFVAPAATGHQASTPRTGLSAAQLGDTHAAQGLLKGVSGQTPAATPAPSLVAAPNLSDIPPSPLDSLAAEVGLTEFLPGRGQAAGGHTVDTAVLSRLRLPIDDTAGAGASLPEATLAQQADQLASQLASLRRSGKWEASNEQPLVAQLGLDQLNPALAPLRGSVELVDNLYTTMIDTLPLSDKLGQSLDTLKLPLAELALTDPGFFQNREHPARLLVERLSEVSALAPQNNSRVENRVEEALSSVAKDFDGDLQVFDQALAKMTELALAMLKQQQRNIQRQVLAEEGKEKREQAQQDVDRDLGQRLPEGLLPHSLVQFIDHFLRDELVLIRLRDGVTELYNAAVTRLVAVGQALQSTMESGNPVPADTVMALTGALTEGLGGEYLDSETDAILKTLQEQLLGTEAIDLVASSLSEPEVFAEPGFSARLAKLPRLSRWVRRARELDIQAWVADPQGDGSLRNLQLIWKNSNNTRFAFANEQGQKVKDINLVQLARDLGRGMRPLAPSEQLSIIEKSVFQTLERRQDDLAGLTQLTANSEYDRSDMVDRVQSQIRRAKRKGASECAIAVHAEDIGGVNHVASQLRSEGIGIVLEGALSPTTHGLIVDVTDPERLQTILAGDSDNTAAAGIGIAPIDGVLSSAEEVWHNLEEVAKRGLAMSPNTGVIAQQQSQSGDLASAVRKTYQRLQDDMPPRFSLQSMRRRPANDHATSETVYQVLLDGTPDSGGDLKRATGYHSAALSIALDCAKVTSLCRFAESVAAAGKSMPLFRVRVSTDAALHHEFLDFLLNEVSESGIGTDRLCFELRDSSRLREAERAADFARTLRSIGCQISVAEVHPKRGSTTQLQALNPNIITLDPQLWPIQEGDQRLSALHQTISDLHHLVGEYVVLRDERDEPRAGELGIDFIEASNDDDMTPDKVLVALPEVIR
ncbi:MAG: DUF1631 family protein [Cellvibrionales bacterium]